MSEENKKISLISFSDSEIAEIMFAAYRKKVPKPDTSEDQKYAFHVEIGDKGESTTAWLELITPKETPCLET